MESKTTAGSGGPDVAAQNAAEDALAKVAIEDDFGARLVKRKGTVSPDIDLEFPGSTECSGE